ncbi:MAG: helix-turn-helix domain-containing protein [Pseudomonas sp.]
MGDHWQRRASLHHTAQLNDRSYSLIQRILRCNSKYQALCSRNYRLALTLAEREEFLRAVVAGNSIRYMAALLGRASSTISLC